MTPEEIRSEVEAVYDAVLQKAKKPKVKLKAEPPCSACSGVTAQSWFVKIPEEARSLSVEEFRVQFGDHAGEELASAGLSYGLTSFAPLRVQDRPAAEHRGSARLHKRKREFIVHAMGWREGAKQ